MRLRKGRTYWVKVDSAGWKSLHAAEHHGDGEFQVLCNNRWFTREDMASIGEDVPKDGLPRVCLRCCDATAWRKLRK